MPTESIVFSPEVDERQLDRETDQVNEQLQDVGRDIPLSFDAEGMDGLAPAGGGGGGRDGIGPGGAAGIGSLASRIPKPVAGITASAALPIAIAGGVGLSMLSAMQNASARLQTSTSLLGVAADNVWRPLGDDLDKLFVRPAVMDLLKATQEFEKTWRAEQEWAAVTGLLGDISGGLSSLPGDIGQKFKLAAATLEIGEAFLEGRIDLPSFSWPTLPEFSWPTLPGFSWPDVPAFDWPGLPSFSWPSLPEFSWPSLPDFSWPDLPSLSWDSFVSTLSWGTFMTSLSWSSFVGPLIWNRYLDSINWRQFVPTVVWSSFVPNVSWGRYVPNLSWGSFISGVNLGNFVSGTGDSDPDPVDVPDDAPGPGVPFPEDDGTDDGDDNSAAPDDLFPGIGDPPTEDETTTGGSGRRRFTPTSASPPRNMNGDTRRVESKLDNVEKEVRKLRDALDMEITVDGETLGRIAKKGQRDRISDTDPLS